MAGKDIVLKYPAGWRGITSMTTNENAQEEIFLPTEGILVAVNADGDTDYGTIVFDLKGNELDPDRAARLQSAFRVLKYPEGSQNCAIGLQLGPSGKKDTKGYFVDRKGGGPPTNQTSTNPNGDPSPAAGSAISIGKGSYFDGGPFDCGTGNCEHKVGQDDEGNPVSKLHLSTKALFRKDDTQDGPLLFEGAISPPAQDLDQRISVHCSWDQGGKNWYWWTTSPMNSMYPYNPGLLQPGTPSYPKFPFDQPQTPLLGLPYPPLTGVPTVGNPPGTPGGPAAPPGVDVYSPFSGGQIGPFVPQSTGGVGDAASLGLQMLIASSPMAAAAMGIIPQNYTGGSLNTGLLPGASAAGRSKAGSNPVTGIDSGFGAQGGSMPAVGGGSGGGNSQTGAGGDPWVYTAQPKGSKVSGKTNSKYPNGTSNGGTCFHPPETDLRDTKIAMAPPNVTLSTCYKLVGPGAYWGCGIPQLVNGSIKDGYSWGMDTVTGDLVYRSHSNSAAPVEAMRFTKTAQTIQWRSSKSFYGELSHANTANRTYTFPDKSGTVALLSDIAGSGTTFLFTHGDQQQTGSTFVSSTWLTFPVTANLNYYFKFVIQYTINTAVSGSKVQIIGPSSPFNLLYWAETENSGGVVVQSGTQSAFGVNVGFATATTGTTYRQTIEGILENGANAGSVTLQFAEASLGDIITVLEDSFVAYSTAT